MKYNKSTFIKIHFKGNDETEYSFIKEECLNLNPLPQSNELQHCLTNSCSGAIPKRSFMRQNDKPLELVRCNKSHTKNLVSV